MVDADTNKSMRDDNNSQLRKELDIIMGTYEERADKRVTPENGSCCKVHA